jgi:hypothetical protein
MLCESLPQKTRRQAEVRAGPASDRRRQVREAVEYEERGEQLLPEKPVLLGKRIHDRGFDKEAPFQTRAGRPLAAGEHPAHRLGMPRLKHQTVAPQASAFTAGDR